MRNVTFKNSVNNLHMELFPEEYDFMSDSIADKKDRDSGVSPMSQIYQDRVNGRRSEFGLSACPLSGHSEDTLKLCQDIIDNNLEDLKRRLLSGLKNIENAMSEPEKWMPDLDFKSSCPRGFWRDRTECHSTVQVLGLVVEFYDSDPYESAVVINPDNNEIVATTLTAGIDTSFVNDNIEELRAAIVAGEYILQRK